MVNVGNGNLIVQADDVDISERGIDLAFRRTYNSRSQHDGANTDHSVPSNYGNGWTNTFDAHITYADNSSIVSLYDIDGARYDYLANGKGGWTPPVGIHATLTLAGTCYYQWTKPNGTAYVFFAPDYSQRAGCSPQNVNGRVYKIFGRNNNNYVTFNYALDSNGNPSEIDAVHADSDKLILTFAYFNGVDQLSKITRPDGQVITYNYDSSGLYLQEVDRPGNNIVTLPEQYSYSAGVLASVSSPRFVLSEEQNGGNPHDGDQIAFSYSGQQLAQTSEFGLVNFVPNDGVASQPLQPSLGTGVSLTTPWRWARFTYGNVNSTCGTTATPCTMYVDSDQHATDWTVDDASRVTELQEYTGSAYLTTTQLWEASTNNLLEVTDPRGYNTDYAYDSNGNTVEVAQPAPTSGAQRPTSLYSYDGNNNLVSYCDPMETDHLGQDWTATPSPGSTPCPTAVPSDSNPIATSGPIHYTWSHPNDTIEPDGSLTDIYTATAYHRAIQYDASKEGAQNVDYGLPTAVVGDPIPQQLDNTTRTPTQTFQYDSSGSGTLVSYDKGNGAWTLSYDVLHRLLVATDPTGASSYTCYFTDGQVQYTENAAQHAADQSPSSCGGGLSLSAQSSQAHVYTYDADGDATSVLDNNRVASNPYTNKFYDGADRLVEVQMPDGAASGKSLELTRYLYDLSAGGTVQLSGEQAMRAYGGLYDTQRWVVPPGGTATQWFDYRGWSYDAADRQTQQFVYDPTPSGSGATLSVSNLSYDAPGYAGLLSGKTDALNVTTSYAYDNAGRTSSISFSDGTTPNRTYTYDIAGRELSVSSSVATDSYSYNGDGTVTSNTQDLGTLGKEALTYDYYADGMRKDLSVSGSLVSQSNLESYTYRADGLAQVEKFTQAGTSGTFSWIHDGAGRVTSFSDPWFTRSRVYNSYGQMTSDNIPNGTYSNITENGDGDVTSFKAYAGTNGDGLAISPTTIGLSYDALDELNTITYSGIDKSQSVTQGQMADIQDATMASPQASCETRLCEGRSISQGRYSFDADGRQAGYSASWSYQVTCVQGNPPQTTTCPVTGNLTDTWSYDAEGHQTTCTNTFQNNSQPGSEGGGPNFSIPPCASGFQYGPDGHLAVATIWGSTNGFPPTPFFWDGDHPLIYHGTTFIGDFATYNEAGTGLLNIQDRDVTSHIVACHNGSGYSVWSVPSIAYNPTSPTGTYLPQGTNKSIACDQVLTKSDGVMLGGVTIQGARSYNPNTQQWTAPDPYQGDVHDPMSMRAYMWNNNNPITYSDPSGYIVAAAWYGHVGGGGSMNLDGAVLPGDPVGGDAMDDVLLQNHAMYGYSKDNVAAYAAGTTIAPEANNSKVEYGAPIYELDGRFGYGATTKGNYDDHVPWTQKSFTAGVPNAATVIGLWHNHPYMDDPIDHNADLEDFYKNNGTQFIFWTTVAGQLVRQSIDASGNLGLPDPLCTACQPPSLLDRGQ